jgi:hypothetical protein
MLIAGIGYIGMVGWKVSLLGAIVDRVAVTKEQVSFRFTDYSAALYALSKVFAGLVELPP